MGRLNRHKSGEKRGSGSERTNPLIIAFGVFMFLVLIYHLSETKNRKSDRENLLKELATFKDPLIEEAEEAEAKRKRLLHPHQIPDGDDTFDVGKLQSDLALAELTVSGQVPRYSFDGGSRVNVEESCEAMSPFGTFYEDAIDSEAFDYISNEFHKTDGKRFSTASGYNVFNKRPTDLLGDEIKTPRASLDFSQQHNLMGTITTTRGQSRDKFDEMEDAFISQFNFNPMKAGVRSAAANGVNGLAHRASVHPGTSSSSVNTDYAESRRIEFDKRRAKC